MWWKIIQFSLYAYLLKANQIIVWYFFQPKLKLTKWLILWQVAGQAGTVLETCYSDHLLRVTGTDKIWMGQCVQHLVSCWDPASISVDQEFIQIEWRWDYFHLLHTHVYQNVNFSS